MSMRWLALRHFASAAVTVIQMSWVKRAYSIFKRTLSCMDRKSGLWILVTCIANRMNDDNRLGHSRPALIVRPCWFLL